MKNSAEQGGCYPQRPKAEVDNTLRDLQNSSYPTKKPNSIIALLLIQNISPFLMSFAISLFVFLLIKNNIISSPGFLGQRFNNLQRAALLTSLIQYGEDSFQIWWTAAGYGKLCMWF